MKPLATVLGLELIKASRIWTALGSNPNWRFSLGGDLKPFNFEFSAGTVRRSQAPQHKSDRFQTESRWKACVGPVLALRTLGLVGVRNPSADREVKLQYVERVSCRTARDITSRSKFFIHRLR